MGRLRVGLLRGVSDLPIIDSYKVGLFKIDVIKDGEKRYIYNPSIGEELQKYINVIEKAVLDLEKSKWVPEERPKEFKDLLRSLKVELAKYFKSSPYYEHLADVAAYEYVGLGRLKPLLDDGYVDEIFQDRTDSPLYLTHRKYGLCETFIILDEREIEALRVFCELFGGPSISLRSPSAKSELRLEEGILRISIDHPPLSAYGPSIHIRKHGRNPFTIGKLIKLGTIELFEAVFLLTALYFGRNVTILGPSGSGKTTLLNALDISLPPNRRRIYVEDAIESLDLSKLGYHQLKLKVDPIEAEIKIGSKHLEVLKSLHRSPDIFILGEVQDAKHSLALFQALASGVRGMQTFHSSGPEQAIRRWTKVHHISVEQIMDLDLLVTMVKPWPHKSFRYVSRISEVDEKGGIRDIFSRPHPLSKSYQLIDLRESRVYMLMMRGREEDEVKKVMTAFEAAIVASMGIEDLEEYVKAFFNTFFKVLGDEGFKLV